MDVKVNERFVKPHQVRDTPAGIESYKWCHLNVFVKALMNTEEIIFGSEFRKPEVFCRQSRKKERRRRRAQQKGWQPGRQGAIIRNAVPSRLTKSTS